MEMQINGKFPVKHGEKKEGEVGGGVKESERRSVKEEKKVEIVIVNVNVNVCEDDKCPMKQREQKN